ncbi:TIGR02594 family protein [Apibacter adventoris]|nr:TIGR02594 family protein [Apibacter adventoris]
MLFKLWSSEISGFSKEKIDVTLWDRQKNLDDKKLERTVNEFNRIFTGYDINTCMQKIVFIALGYAETRFRLLGEDLSEYSSSKSIYKGRGFHQLTGIQDSSGLYNEAGPYENYANFVGNKNIISQPDLLCTQIHYAIDSAGWFWTDKDNGKSVPNWSSASNTEYIKFRAEYFSKALGKQLNEVSHLVEEDEKYFWLQAKMLNGYPKGQKLETNPNGWATRKKAFDILKNEVFEFDKRCKGNEELEFTGDRAPWMNVAIQEGIKYKNCNEKQEPLKAKVSNYHKVIAGQNWSSKIAWCASFANWCIKETKQYSFVNSAGSLSISTSSQFKKIDKPIFGALVVFKNYKQSNGKGCGHGHVTFLFGKTKDGKLICLGGNQGDRIKLSSYNHNGITGSFNCMNECGQVNQKFLGFYIPKDYEIKESDYLTDDDIYDQSIDALNNKILNAKTKTNENESNR